MKRLLTVALCVALASCAGLSVQDEGGHEKGGVPFLTRVPVRVHQTKVVRASMRVTVVARAKTLLLTEPIYQGETTIADNAESEAAVKNLGAALKKAQPKTYGEAVSTIDGAMTALARFSQVAQPEVVANTWRVDTTISPERYYIANRLPLIGTASATYKIGSDGTLSEATMAAEDKTASTLLSLVPVASYLSHQWHLDGKSVVDGTSKSHLYQAMPTKLDVEVQVAVTKIGGTYTLEARRPLNGDTTLAGTFGSAELACPGGAESCDPSKRTCLCGCDYEPLTLTCAEAGRGGVQIVSVAPIGKDDEKKEAPAYGISGKITLPQTDAGAGK